MPLFDIIQATNVATANFKVEVNALQSGGIATNKLNATEKLTCDYINAVRAKNGLKRLSCVYDSKTRLHATNLAAGKAKGHDNFASRAKGHRAAGENMAPVNVALYWDPARTITVAKRNGRKPFVKNSKGQYVQHKDWAKLRADSKAFAETATIGWWDDMANATQRQAGMGHRKNILNKTWDKIAVGYAKKGSKAYIVANFYYK